MGLNPYNAIKLLEVENHNLKKENEKLNELIQRGIDQDSILYLEKKELQEHLDWALDNLNIYHIANYSTCFPVSCKLCGSRGDSNYDIDHDDTCPYAQARKALKDYD